MHTRRQALAVTTATVLGGLAGCSDMRFSITDDEREDLFEPDVTPEPLPDGTPLPPGIVHSDVSPYLEIEDHLAVSNAHMEYLAEFPAFRIIETLTNTTYLRGAEVVDWDVEGEADNIHTTHRKTTVTDAAYLKAQQYDYTKWSREIRQPQEAFERYIDYTEYFAVDAHVYRFDDDYEEFDIEGGDTDDKTTRYMGMPDEAEREFREAMKKLRDPDFGLAANIYEVERVEGGMKLKTYEGRLAPESDEQHDHPGMDSHRFHYWLFDDAGFIRERRKMYLFPQDREQVAFSVGVQTKRWEPLEESPGTLRPEWVDDARDWEYPDEWWDNYDGPRDK